MSETTPSAAPVAVPAAAPAAPAAPVAVPAAAPAAPAAPVAKLAPAVPPVGIDRAVLRAAIRADARWIMEELSQTLAGADTATGNPIDG